MGNTDNTPAPRVQILTMIFSSVSAVCLAFGMWILTDMSADVREMRGEMRDHLRFHLEHTSVASRSK